MIRINKEVTNISEIKRLDSKEIWIVQEDYSVLKLTEKGFKKMSQLTNEHVPILKYKDGNYEECFYDFSIKANLLFIKSFIIKLESSNNTLTIFENNEIELNLNELYHLLIVSRFTNRPSFFKKLSKQIYKPIANLLGVLGFLNLGYFDLRAVQTLMEDCPSIFSDENLENDLPFVFGLCCYAIYLSNRNELTTNYFKRLIGTNHIQFKVHKHYFSSIISEAHLDFFELFYYEYMICNEMQFIKRNNLIKKLKVNKRANETCLYASISKCVSYEECLTIAIQRALENNLCFTNQLPYLIEQIDDILYRTKNDYTDLVSYINFYDYRPLMKVLETYLETKPYFTGEKLKTKDLLLFGQSQAIIKLKERGYDQKRIEYFLDALDVDAVTALSIIQDKNPLSKKKQKEIEEYLIKA